MSTGAILLLDVSHSNMGSASSPMEFLTIVVRVNSAGRVTEDRKKVVEGEIVPVRESLTLAPAVTAR